MAAGGSGRYGKVDAKDDGDELICLRELLGGPNFIFEQPWRSEGEGEPLSSVAEPAEGEGSFWWRIQINLFDVLCGQKI